MDDPTPCSPFYVAFANKVQFQSKKNPPDQPSMRIAVNKQANFKHTHLRWKPIYSISHKHSQPKAAVIL